MTPGEQAMDEMTAALEEITSVRMNLAVDWTPIGESAISLKTDIEQMKETMDYHMALTVTQGTGSNSQEVYVINEPDDLTYAYVKERKNWRMYESDPKEEDIARQILLTAGSEWKVKEEVEFDGIPCVVLTGLIDSKNLSKVMKASGLNITTMNSDAEGAVTIYQDKETKLPVSLVIDYGAFGSVEAFLILCTYYGFNDLEAILVPEEVKKSAAR